MFYEKVQLDVFLRLKLVALEQLSHVENNETVFYTYRILQFISI